MIKTAVLFVILFCLSLTAYAGRQYQTTGGVFDRPGDAFKAACIAEAVNFPANNYDFQAKLFNSGTFTSDFWSAAQTYGLLDAPLGRNVSVRCRALLNNLEYQYYQEIITPVQSCTAGFPSRFIKLTTIASFATNGDVVPADRPSNPQCVDTCQVSHPGGQGATSIAYSNIFDSIDVGTVIWTVDTVGITQNGLTCNFLGADAQDMVTNDDIPPLDQLNDLVNQKGNTGGNSGGATTGGGLTSSQDGLLNSIYNNTQSASTKLDNIDAKIDSLLSGTGGNPDGTPDVIDVGTFGVMPQAPIAEVPSGGLVSPSETGLTTFKSGLFSSPDRAPGACPTWTVHIALLASTSTHGDYTFNQHCALVDSHRGALETVMTVIWSVGALALVLKA